jgi:hypothetical protein
MRRQLARAGMAERGKAGAADDFGLGKQSADHRFERGRTEQHGLLAAPRVQQAIGEDVAAFAVGGELRLVERDEGQVRVHRHRFDRAQQPARAGWLDPLLAGDQRNLSAPLIAQTRS